MTIFVKTVFDDFFRTDEEKFLIDILQKTKV